MKCICRIALAIDGLFRAVRAEMMSNRGQWHAMTRAGQDVLATMKPPKQRTSMPSIWYHSSGQPAHSLEQTQTETVPSFTNFKTCAWFPNAPISPRPFSWKLGCLVPSNYPMHSPEAFVRPWTWLYATKTGFWHLCFSPLRLSAHNDTGAFPNPFFPCRIKKPSLKTRHLTGSTAF